MQSNPSSHLGTNSRQWAEIASAHIYNDLLEASTSGELHNWFQKPNVPFVIDFYACGPEIIGQLRRASGPSVGLSEAKHILEHLGTISEDIVKLESTSSRSVSLHSRRLYAECRLLHSLFELRDPDVSDTTEDRWERAVTRLDMAIIIVGAPGEGRLDLILDTIDVIQAEYLPMRDCSRHITLTLEDGLPSVDVKCLASNIIPRIPPPSISTFRRTSSLPFILPGFINDWPALTNHSWNSLAYLLRISGRGRVVPVEVGSDYRADDWNQKILPWEVFLRGIGVATDLHNDKKNGSEQSSQFDVAGIGKEALYLAQHTLLTQFPALRSDIIVPDYVYSSPPPPSTCPMYRPPGNDENLVINAWLGPMGTLSPAHTVRLYPILFYVKPTNRPTFFRIGSILQLLW
jgi:hypothetical protein